MAPPGPVLGAVLRRWYLVLLPALVLAGGAVAIALNRAPTYTAEARLNVGGFSITTQSLPGFAGGAFMLANAYSRVAYADQVLGPVAKAVGKNRGQIAAQISSSPVKDSPIIRIDAKSRSKDDAIAVANLVAQHLQTYAAALARSNPDSKRLLADYKAAAHNFRVALQRARVAHRRHKGSDAADTALDLAKLRQTVVGGLYSASLEGQASTNVVQLLNPAHTATSDRRALLERLLAGAVLGGLAIGVGLAVLRDRAVTRRRLRR
jgi:capsular polysaccharide biosynthesis protein